MDISEKWIRKFAEQNAAYMVVWSDRYHEVEAWMEEFQVLSCVDRWASAKAHERWLLGKMTEDSLDGIPFREEAELFSPFYWSNKAKYEKSMKLRGR